MKSGVVLELSGGNAVVLDGSGSFRTVGAKSDWRPGDVVPLASKRKKSVWALPLAACLAAVLLGGGGYFWLDETALVSLDVNPSVELGLNRFERVISVTTRNDGGAELLAAVEVRGETAEKAVEKFLESDYLRPYLAGSGGLTLSVQSDDAALAPRLENAASAVGERYGVECHRVDAATVEEAHHYGVTAGKYLALLELQAADPALDISDYTHCTIAEIRNEAAHCQEAGHGQAPAAPADPAPTPTPAPGEGGGNGNGYGGGNGNGHHGGYHHGE